MIATRASPMRCARLPDYLGGHVLVSVTALALGLAVSLPLALVSRAPAGAARAAAGGRERRADHSRAWRCWRCSIRCCSALAALTERLFGVGFSALGFLPSVLALALYSMLPVLRNTITGLDGVDPAVKRGRARRRHDAAAVAVHGRAAARAAGDHGRHPHRRGLGDRHRDAVDADRPDQPRQLHLHRPADAELGVRAVRLRRRGGAGARGRPAAGADGDAASRARKRARVAAGALGLAADRCAALAARPVAGRARPTSSAPSRSPSNTSWPR